MYTIPALLNHTMEQGLEVLMRRYSQYNQVHSPRVHIDQKKSFSAYYNGSDIHIAKNNPFSLAVLNNSDANKPKEAILILYGLLLHEFGHFIFTDLSVMEIDPQNLESYSFSSSEIVKDYEDEIEKIQSLAKQDETFHKRFIRFFHQIVNILEDGFIEIAVGKSFQGFYSDCLEYMREVFYETNSEHIEMIDNNLLEGKTTELRAILSVMLSYGLYRKYKTKLSADALLDLNVYQLFVSEYQYSVDKIINEYDVFKRYQGIYEMALKLSPLFIEEYMNLEAEQKSDNDGDSDKTGNEDNTSSQEESKNNAKNPQTSTDDFQEMRSKLEDSQGDPSKWNRASSPHEETEVGESQSFEPMSRERLEQLMDDLSQQLRNAINSEQKQKEKQEKEKKENEYLDDKKIINELSLASVHRDFSIEVHEYSSTHSTKSDYDELYHQVQSEIKALKRQLQRLMRESNQDKHALPYGQRLDRSSFSRKGKNYYASTVVQGQRNELSVIVLVDESGSMAGKNIHMAKLTTIILGEMCRELNIPLAIYGHDGTDTVNLHKYIEFNEKDNLDKLSLLSARVYNRDGAALTFCLEKIMKFNKTNKKLCFIISDGQPNHYRYSGEAAIIDIQNILKKYNQRVKIIAAAIDQDKEVIEKMYGKSYLEVDNLSTLPTKLVRIIKKEVFD